MSTDPVHPSAVGTYAKPKPRSADQVFDENTLADDPSLPPQRHAGAVSLGPNYPVGPTLGDELKGTVEIIKGKLMGKPELVDQGRERRAGDLMRRERKQDDAANPFEGMRTEGK